MDIYAYCVFLIDADGVRYAASRLSSEIIMEIRGRNSGYKELSIWNPFNTSAIFTIFATIHGKRCSKGKLAFLLPSSHFFIEKRVGSKQSKFMKTLPFTLYAFWKENKSLPVLNTSRLLSESNLFLFFANSLEIPPWLKWTEKWKLRIICRNDNY
jgi:hypothetical protein